MDTLQWRTHKSPSRNPNAEEYDYGYLHGRDSFRAVGKVWRPIRVAVYWATFKADASERVDLGGWTNLEDAKAQVERAWRQHKHLG